MTLIDDWKKSYKLYSMQIAIIIMLVSVADVILHQMDIGAIPRWVFYCTGPGVAIARIVSQFMDS